MELLFLALLMIIMATALGSGYPVAFALPGAAIITIVLAAASGYLFAGNSEAYFHSGGPYQWLSAGVTNLRGVYWEVERDTLIAIPLFIFMGIMLICRYMVSPMRRGRILRGKPAISITASGWERSLIQRKGS